MASPGLAPDRRMARCLRTSPITVMLMSTLSCRVVSPPASSQRSARDARRYPPKKEFSHFPVKLSGNAKLSRKQRGLPPMAATSLTARARHFQPTTSGGCLPRRKCEPSRNQSHVRIVSWPGDGVHSAASSPKAKGRILLFVDRNLRSIHETRAFSLFLCFIGLRLW